MLAFKVKGSRLQNSTQLFHEIFPPQLDRAFINGLQGHHDTNTDTNMYTKRYTNTVNLCTSEIFPLLDGAFINWLRGHHENFAVQGHHKINMELVSAHHLCCL